MSREEIHKLLGGYATDTLTNAERKALFDAALEDQELFDALAAEEPLREMLSDDRTRCELLAALGPAKPQAPKRWVFPHTWTAAAASVCVAAIALGIVWRMQPAREKETFVAQAPVADRVSIQAAPPPASVPVGPPRSQDLKRRERTVALRMEAPPARENESDTVAARPPSPAPASAGPVAAEPLGYAQAGGEVKKEVAEESRLDTLASRRQAAPEMQSSQVAKITIPVQAKFLATRYRLFKKDPAGRFQEMGDAEVSRGDTILFEVTPTRDGQITVSMSEANDSQTVYTGMVNAGVSYRIPLGGLQIAGEPGTRAFSIRWSLPPPGVRAVQQGFKDQRSMQAAGAYGQSGEPDEIKLILTVR